MDIRGGHKMYYQKSGNKNKGAEFDYKKRNGKPYVKALIDSRAKNLRIKKKDNHKIIDWIPSQNELDRLFWKFVNRNYTKKCLLSILDKVLDTSDLITLCGRTDTEERNKILQTLSIMGIKNES